MSSRLAECRGQAELIREARLRAGLTQKELSELTSRERSVIARWEQGVISPPLDSLMQIIHACGFDLPMTLLPIDKSADEELRDALLKTPSDRVERLIRAHRSKRAPTGRSKKTRRRPGFRGLRPLRASRRPPGTARQLRRDRRLRPRAVRGTRELTDGIDITPSMREDNLDRLQAALDGLDARRADGKRLDVRRLPRRLVWNSRRAPVSSSSSQSRPAPVATTTSAAAPTVNRSGVASARRSPPPETSLACSAPSTAPKTSSASSASAAFMSP